jgi:hypothetical protein
MTKSSRRRLTRDYRDLTLLPRNTLGTKTRTLQTSSSRCSHHRLALSSTAPIPSLDRRTVASETRDLVRAPPGRPLQRHVELRHGQDDLLDARGAHDERHADDLADGDAGRLARVFRIASSRMHVCRKEGHVDGGVDAAELDDLLHERYEALTAELEPEQTPALVGRDPQHLRVRVVLHVAEGAGHERGWFAGSAEADGGRDGAGHVRERLESGIVVTADDDVDVDELQGRRKLIVTDDLCPHGRAACPRCAKA